MSPNRANRCRICGCGAVQTDEVVHLRRWLLAECERCHHRWTEELPDRPASARRVRLTRGAEVARAA
jgi:hypothetical protein